MSLEELMPLSDMSDKLEEVKKYQKEKPFKVKEMQHLYDKFFDCYSNLHPAATKYYRAFFQVYDEIIKEGERRK